VQISELVIDGGNVIRTKDKVIMCAKVFKENKEVSEKVLINKLKEYFEIDKLFFLPWGKSDFTGHADGMVRFINENRVLINHYSNPKENQEFQQSVRICLHNAGLEWTEIPYNPYVNKPYTKATGIYLNYLEMKDIIIFPTFKIPEDDLAIRVIQELFPDHIIKTIDSNIIAEKGGVLNCITWNIKK
jgi:agmatine deiminase